MRCVRVCCVRPVLPVKVMVRLSDLVMVMGGSLVSRSIDCFWTAVSQRTGNDK